MKIYDILNPKKYQDKTGAEKTNWLNVGTMKVTDGGAIFIEMNDNDKSFIVKERQIKALAQQTRNTASNEDVELSSIPF